MKVKKIVEHRHFTKDSVRNLCEENGWMMCGNVLNRYDRLYNLLCRGDTAITNTKIFNAATLIIRFSHNDTVDSVEHVMDKIIKCANINYEVVYEGDKDT